MTSPAPTPEQRIDNALEAWHRLMTRMGVTLPGYLYTAHLWRVGLKRSFR